MNGTSSSIVRLVCAAREGSKSAASRLCIGLILVCGVSANASRLAHAQDLEIYETSLFGTKDLTPSIIIDENSRSGDYDVYSVSRLGLRNINPDAIITSNEYSGVWKVYRVSDYGVKNLFPAATAETNTWDGTVRIYDVNEMGLKDIAPSTIIERRAFSDEARLYNVNEYGLKSVSPFEIVRKQGSHYNVYAVNKYGVPDITPSRIIEVKDQPSVFGVLLLPSIKQITFDPGHVKLKDIQRVKVMPDTLLEKEGWRVSKPRKKAEEK